MAISTLVPRKLKAADVRSIATCVQSFARIAHTLEKEQLVNQIKYLETLFFEETINDRSNNLELDV